MDSVLGQPGALGQQKNAMTGGPGGNPLVSPSSMQPAAMSNMMGSPLGNEGANMNPYLSMQQTFTPEPLQTGSSRAPTYNMGGLVRFAEGGMPQDPMAGGGAPPPEMGAAPQGGLPPPEGQEGDIDPNLKAQVEQIFTDNLQDPRKIADLLLQLVEGEIKKVVSPEQLEQLHSPEGQQMLKQIVEQMMQQMQGGGEGAEGALGQMAGGGGEAAGAGAPPGGAPQGALPGMAYGGVVDSW